MGYERFKLEKSAADFPSGSHARRLAPSPLSAGHSGFPSQKVYRGIAGKPRICWLQPEHCKPPERRRHGAARRARADALRLPSRRRGDSASSTHLTIGNRANRRLFWCTDSSARYVVVQRDDRASFGDTKSGTCAAHEEQKLPISVGYSARLDGSDA
jgi:hypothetical protein